VNESEKRRKIDEIKREQNAEKIIEVAANRIGVKKEDLYKSISAGTGNYSSLHEFFESAAKDQEVLESIKIDKAHLKIIDETVKQRIKPSEVEITGKLKITIFASNGIELIKEALKKAIEATNDRLNVNYLGSGSYRFMIKAPDYKEAEKILKNASESAISNIVKHAGIAEFTRE